MTIEAVIFDMDGVLVDSEPVWHTVREQMASERGDRWTEEDQRQCMGRSTLHWATYMRERLSLAGTVDDVIVEVRDRMIAEYDRSLPVLPGAVEAVRRMAGAFRTAVASGSMTALLDHVLAVLGVDRVVDTVVHGDTIQNGKPAPDIYLEAARRLGVDPARCAGVEDSVSGLRSVRAAGMRVVVVPSPYPLPEDVLALADLRLGSLDELTVDAVRALGRTGAQPA